MSTQVTIQLTINRPVNATVARAIFLQHFHTAAAAAAAAANDDWCLGSFPALPAPGCARSGFT